MVSPSRGFQSRPLWGRIFTKFLTMRIENLPRLGRVALVKDVLMQYAEDLKSGSIVIATQKKYRIRKPFP